MKESNKKKLQGELDSLMQDFNSNFSTNNLPKSAEDAVGQSIDAVMRPHKTYDFDSDVLDDQFKKLANGLITSMFDFYAENGILDRVEYARRKRDLDSANVSNMLWQLKTVKLTITVLMDEIVSGNTNAKTIAALADMQSRFSEIMRMQANYVVFLEDTYKKIKYDAIASDVSEDAAERERNEDDANSEYYMTANPKELVRQITEIAPLTETEIEEMRGENLDCIAKDPSDREHTDPLRKEDLMRAKNYKPSDCNAEGDGYNSILEMI